MSGPRVLLDACVLVPYTLCDYLLTLADAEWFAPLWSEEILAEVARTLQSRFGLDPVQVDRRLGAMRSAFPHASVTGWQSVVSRTRNDPKDRHVLAAAITGEADVLVTANIRDFQDLHPAEDLRLQTPDHFLVTLTQGRAAAARQVLDVMAGRTTRPRRSAAELVTRLENLAPDAARQLGGVPADKLPLPLELTDPSDAFAAMFPHGGPDLSTPRGAAFSWWLGLDNLAEYPDVARSASANPAVWGDFTEAAATVDGWSFMEKEHANPDEPEAIVYLHLMPDPGFAGRAFMDFPLEEALIITTIRCTDGLWRVWGLSRDHHPSPQEIFGPS